MAKDASEAIRKERNTKVDDIWVDEDWRKGTKDRLAEAIGFIIETK